MCCTTNVNLHISADGVVTCFSPPGVLTRFLFISPFYFTLLARARTRSPVSRTRSVPLCAIVVGQGKEVGSEEDRKPSSQGSTAEPNSSEQHEENLSISSSSSASQSTAQRYGFEPDHTRHSGPRPLGYVGEVGGTSISPVAERSRDGMPTYKARTGKKTVTSASAAAAVAPAVRRSPSPKTSRSEAATSNLDNAEVIDTEPRRKGESNEDAKKEKQHTGGAGEVLSGGVGAGAGGETRLPEAVIVAGVGSAVAGNERGAVEQSPSTLFAGDAERAAERAAEDAEAAAVAAEEGIRAEQEEGVPLRMGRRWKKRVTFVARTMQIWAFLFNVLIKLLRQKLVQRDEARMSARRRKLGKYLCRAFLKLGPTFIKIGQVGVALGLCSFVALLWVFALQRRSSTTQSRFLAPLYKHMCRTRVTSIIRSTK